MGGRELSLLGSHYKGGKKLAREMKRRGGGQGEGGKGRMVLIMAFYAKKGTFQGL